jgi:PAS domain S-box-containing protein
MDDAESSLVASEQLAISSAKGPPERVTLQRAYDNSEIMCRQLFDGIADGLVVHTRDGHIIDVNLVTCRRLHYSREELLSLSVGEIEVGITPDDLNRIWDAAYNGADLTIEGRNRRRDGSTFPVEVHVGPISYSNEPLIFATVRDITERKSAEAALQAAQQKNTRELAEWKSRYDLLVQATRQIVYDYDASGRLVWGDTVESLLGYTAEELTGQVEAWLEHVHPEDRAQAQAARETAQAAQVSFSTQYRFRAKDGRYLLLHDTGYPQRDERGQLQRYLGVIADVTEKMQAQAERLRLEEILRQSQKMESIGRLAGGVAHDFNNLLTAIGGNLALAELENPTLLGNELLDEAKKAVDSATKLTRQLLAFSRQQVISPKVLCLNDTVNRLQQMLRRFIGEHIELVVKTAPSLGSMRVDEGQIEQLIVNLVVNARDAMPDGGRLSIETANVEPNVMASLIPVGVVNTKHVMLAISDNGLGMTDEVKDHLFEPFFTTKDIGKGTGLGLATVYGAVRQNEGHILVQSELGLGTTIRVYFPACDENSCTHSELPPPSEHNRGSETIVVVEDEERVRHLAVRVLERQGYRVLAFENGEAALAALRKLPRPPDLLLTDVLMPGMNGRVLAERATSLIPELKVLFTSGYAEDVITHNDLFNTDIEFIPKPYSVQALIDRIREVLDK